LNPLVFYFFSLFFDFLGDFPLKESIKASPQKPKHSLKTRRIMLKHLCIFTCLIFMSWGMFAQNGPKPGEQKTQPQPEMAQPVESATPVLKVDPASSSFSVRPQLAPAAPEAEIPLTTAEWPETDFDFGTIKQGEIARHVFKVKNTGTQPLKISRVKPSCGCTTPNWTKEPIPPGGEGEIEVAFDSGGKSGIQRKTVTVFLNTEERAVTLRFNGEIVVE